MGSMIKAELLGPAGEVLATTVHQAPLVIGSSPKAGLRVQGEGIAEEQLTVLPAGPGEMLLRQLDEEHPTKVGALLLSEAETPSPVTIRMGAVDLRLSRADEAHSRRHVSETDRPPRLRAWGLFAALTGIVGIQAYLYDYTDSPGEEAAYLAIGVAVLTLLWAGLWAMGNRLFRYPLAFARHLRVVALFFLVAMVLAQVEAMLLAAVHVDGLESFLNWTVWGLWWIAFAGAHMAVAGSWSRRRMATVAGAIYYGMFALVALFPSDPAPVEQVRFSLHPLGHLPAGLYRGAASDVLRTDAEALVSQVDELPAEEVAGGG